MKAMKAPIYYGALVVLSIFTTVFLTQRSGPLVAHAEHEHTQTFPTYRIAVSSPAQDAVVVAGPGMKTVLIKNTGSHPMDIVLRDLKDTQDLYPRVVLQARNSTVVAGELIKVLNKDKKVITLEATPLKITDHR